MFGAQALAKDITLWNKWNKRLKDLGMNWKLSKHKNDFYFWA
jgi:hypothetical protein